MAISCVEQRAVLSRFNLQSGTPIYYRYLDDPGVHEALAIGGALILMNGWCRDMMQLGFGGCTCQPLATSHDAGGTGLLRKDGS
jgi:hypothetical protein